MATYHDLENRFERFAGDTKQFLRTVPPSIEKDAYGGQLLRASSSTAANYLEGNESLTKKEKIHRFGIARKEAKESRLFLRLLKDSGGDEVERSRLENEATEIMNILGAILHKFGI